MRNKTLLLITLVIGIMIGYAWSYQANKLSPTKIYEDGSYYGCLQGAICNEELQR